MQECEALFCFIHTLFKYSTPNLTIESCFIFRIFIAMKSIKDIITIDPETMGGQAVFTGTRVPVESLFMHLEKGISLNEFLEDFPSVKQEQAIAILELAEKLVSSKNIEKLYEIAA